MLLGVEGKPLVSCNVSSELGFEVSSSTTVCENVQNKERKRKDYCVLNRGCDHGFYLFQVDQSDHVVI